MSLPKKQLNFMEEFIMDFKLIVAIIAITSGAATPVLHLVTGLAAIVLMAFHFLWAGYVLWLGSEKSKRNFHKFSLLVWLFWLIPYVAGLVMGMSN